CRSYKCLARSVSRRNRKRTLLELEAERSYRLEHHSAGNATQDTVIGRTGDDLTLVRHDPGIGRGSLGDKTFGVDQPSFAATLLGGGLPPWLIWQPTDGFDIDARPAQVRCRNHGYALLRFVLAFSPIEATCGHHHARRDLRRWKGMIASRDPARHLEIDDAITHAVAP